MKNILYLPYFIFKADYKKVFSSMKCASKEGRPRLVLAVDMVLCSMIYGTSFIDYFNFRFHRKGKSERASFASMGMMYNFHKKVNDQTKVSLVDDKFEFARNFKKFTKPSFRFEAKQQTEILSFFKVRIGKTVVVKDVESTAGRGVQFLTISESGDGNVIVDGEEWDIWFSNRAKLGSIYIEDYLVQHEAINRVSPTGLNTIRVITLIEDGEVKILGAAFRISVNSKLDNFSAGNLAADVDVKTGIVRKGGIRKLAACDQYHDLHPITSMPIKGLKIPHWEKIKTLVDEAAKVIPEVRTIGWDIAVLDDGPFLIEGNSKWNKDTWQIPADEGRLGMIKKYL